MKKFKVKALSVGGHNNKIYHSGDVVSEKNFPPGNTEELVKHGFLVPASETEEFTVGQPSDDENSDTGKSEPSDTISGSSTGNEAGNSTEKKTKTFVNASGQTITVDSIEGITKKELIKELTDAKIIIAPSDSKPALYDLWINK